MSANLSFILNLEKHSNLDDDYASQCKATLDKDGVLPLRDFLTAEALESIRQEGEDHAHKAYYTASDHNVYLSPEDKSYSSDHPRNRSVASSKGCITTDQIPAGSKLHALYNNETFKAFLCSVLDEATLHKYADPLSSINLHYASEGQELGWHFDNSSFAITLLIQKPEAGGVFEYIKDARDADGGEMNYDGVAKILNGDEKPSKLSMNAGDLVLFRGRNSIHRVTPTLGQTTRMLVVLAYNTKAGVSLSESARQTFYGRLK